MSSLQEGDATTSNDAFFNGCLGVTHGVLNAVLALLQFHLGGSTNLDHCHAAGQLSQAFLQLLAVVLGVGVVNLSADLVHAAFDLLGVASAFDDGGIVFGHHDLAGAAQHRQVSGFEGQANFFGDDLTTGEDGNVLQLCLAALTKARSFDGHGLEGAADLVHHEGG